MIAPEGQESSAGEALPGASAVIPESRRWSADRKAEEAATPTGTAPDPEPTEPATEPVTVEGPVRPPGPSEVPAASSPSASGTEAAVSPTAPTDGPESTPTGEPEPPGRPPGPASPPAAVMAVAGVTIDLPQTFPVVTLVEVGGSGRLLRFPVGLAEGSALAYALEGVPTPRPLTHDVVAEIFGHFGIDVELVRITGLEGRTLLAEMVVSEGPKRYTVACRPSDGLALALRAPVTVPIMVAEDVMAAAGEPAEDLGPDSSGPDSSGPDSSDPDFSEAEPSDARSSDTGSSDTGSSDTGSSDTGSSDADPSGADPPDGALDSARERESDENTSPSGGDSAAREAREGESTPRSLAHRRGSEPAADLPAVGPASLGRTVEEDPTGRRDAPGSALAAPAGDGPASETQAARTTPT